MKKSMAEIFQNGINNFNPYTILNGVDQFTSLNETTKNNWFLTNTGIIEVKFTNDSYSIENKFNYRNNSFDLLDTAGIMKKSQTKFGRI